MTKNSIYVDVKFCLAAHEISFKVCTAQNFSSLFLFTLKSLPLLFLLNKLHNVVSFVICFIFQLSFLWIMRTLPRVSSWMFPFSIITINYYVNLILLQEKVKFFLISIPTYLLCFVVIVLLLLYPLMCTDALWENYMDTIIIVPLQ